MMGEAAKRGKKKKMYIKHCKVVTSSRHDCTRNTHTHIMYIKNIKYYIIRYPTRPALIYAIDIYLIILRQRGYNMRVKSI